jgi:hypothetical protein
VVGREDERWMCNQCKESLGVVAVCRQLREQIPSERTSIVNATDVAVHGVVANYGSAASHLTSFTPVLAVLNAV